MPECVRATEHGALAEAFPLAFPSRPRSSLKQPNWPDSVLYFWSAKSMHQGLYVRRYGYGPHRITYSIISYTKTYQKYVYIYINIYIYITYKYLIFFCWNSFNELSPASSKRLHSPQAKVAGSFETFEISQGPVERTHPPDAPCEPREPWQLGSTRLEMQSCAHPFKQDHHAETMLIKRTDKTIKLIGCKINDHKR